LINEVNFGLDGLKDKAERIGDQLDHQEIGVNELQIEISKAHAELVNSNKRLKKILFEV